MCCRDSTMSYEGVQFYYLKILSAVLYHESVLSNLTSLHYGFPLDNIIHSCKKKNFSIETKAVSYASVYSIAYVNTHTLYLLRNLLKCAVASRLC